MDRYIELNAIREMRTLTREEAKEFETLFNSREAAKQDAQVLAARAENERLHRQFQAQQQNAQVEGAWRHLFTAVINGLQPMDTTANREVINSWLQPGETVADSRDWFKTVLSESPQLAKQISWTKYLTPAQKKAQAESDERSLRLHFVGVCRDHGISECTANWSAWSQLADPVITELEGRKVVLDSEGNAIPLVSATPEELQNWEQQRFDQHQSDLRRMQKANDIKGLRAMAHQERAQQYQNSATLRRDRELASQYAKDTLAGFTEPLPRVFDKKTIYGWDAKIMREKISRYGASRITARIYGLTEIENPDKPGEIIKFED